jgi:hypothetical protein
MVLESGLDEFKTLRGEGERVTAELRKALFQVTSPPPTRVANVLKWRNRRPITQGARSSSSIGFPEFVDTGGNENIG